MHCNIYKKVKKIGASDKKIKEIVGNTLKKTKRKDACISVSFIGEKRMKTLNNLYRGQNKVTDVLSFTTEEKSDLGDIFICLPQIKKQAKEYDISLREELFRMIIHGVLHLSGYTHNTTQKAGKMFNLQEKILQEVL